MNSFYNECRKYTVIELKSFVEARTPGAINVIVQHGHSDEVKVLITVDFLTLLLNGRKIRRHVQRQIDENVIMIGKVISVHVN